MRKVRCAAVAILLGLMGCSDSETDLQEPITDTENSDGNLEDEGDDDFEDPIPHEETFSIVDSLYPSGRLTNLDPSVSVQSLSDSELETICLARRHAGERLLNTKIGSCFTVAIFAPFAAALECDCEVDDVAECESAHVACLDIYEETEFVPSDEPCEIELDPNCLVTIQQFEDEVFARLEEGYVMMENLSCVEALSEDPDERLPPTDVCEALYGE